MSNDDHEWNYTGEMGIRIPSPNTVTEIHLPIYEIEEEVEVTGRGTVLLMSMEKNDINSINKLEIGSYFFVPNAIWQIKGVEAQIGFKTINDKIGINAIKIYDFNENTKS